MFRRNSKNYFDMNTYARGEFWMRNVLRELVACSFFLLGVGLQKRAGWQILNIQDQRTFSIAMNVLLSLDRCLPLRWYSKKRVYYFPGTCFRFFCVSSAVFFAFCVISVLTSTFEVLLGALSLLRWFWILPFKNPFDPLAIIYLTVIDHSVPGLLYGGEATSRSP